MSNGCSLGVLGTNKKVGVFQDPLLTSLLRWLRDNQIRYTVKGHPLSVRVVVSKNVVTLVALKNAAWLETLEVEQ